jgi:hypothetical protein
MRKRPAASSGGVVRVPGAAQRQPQAPLDEADRAVGSGEPRRWSMTSAPIRWGANRPAAVRRGRSAARPPR